MSLNVRILNAFIVGLLAAAAFGQDVGDQAQSRHAAKIPTEGFWPTQKMMVRFIDRITEEMADQYDLDDSQLDLTRQLFKARFPEFLSANRAEIQTLMNQYFEALLDDEPPSPEAVARWAQGVQPLLAEFGQVLNEVTEGMREYLNDEQQMLLDAELAGFEAGMLMAQNKLGVWAAGGYDPEVEWVHEGRSSRRRGAETEGGRDRSESPAAEGLSKQDTPAGQAAASSAQQKPKDAWTIHTEQFIERYQLNEEQKQKAYTFLRRQQELRDRYLRRKVNEMARVTKLLKDAETAEQRTAALEAYERLDVPVQRLFNQLKELLDTLPTRSQRRAAGQAEHTPSAPKRDQFAEPAGGKSAESKYQAPVGQPATSP